MTQLVLLLYEDPKADPLSENRFHVEMHFSPGAKTMDDPEFLARNSPTRKRSVEDVRHAGACKPAHGIDVGTAGKMSQVNENQVMGVGQDSQDVLNDSLSAAASVGGLETSSQVVSTSSNPEHSESVEREQEVTGGYAGSSQSPELNSTEEEPSESGDFEAFDDKPFDETVYAGNERPRCSIGIDDYSDSAIGASSGDSAVSSGTSIEGSSGEEKLLTRQRNSLSESDITSVRGGVDRRCKSDSEVTTVGTSTRGVVQGKEGGQEKSSVASITEEVPLKPRSLRPKAHSISGGSPTVYTPSSSESPDDSNIYKFSQGMFQFNVAMAMRRGKVTSINKCFIRNKHSGMCLESKWKSLAQLEDFQKNTFSVIEQVQHSYE